MIVWTVANQKGGVGKTTTVASLAGLLSTQNKRVLLIDTDPHASLTSYLDYDSDLLDGTLFDLFGQEAPDRHQVERVILQTRFTNICLIPASIALSTLDRTLGDRPLDGLEDLLQGLFPWHRRTGRMGGRGEHETDGKGGCGGRHNAIAARNRADHEDSPVLVGIAEGMGCVMR